MKILKEIFKFFNIQYKLWINKNEPKSNELNGQKSFKFNFEPKISIVTALYNTPKKYLIQMIDSVLTQTYTNFELCIAVGSVSDNKIEKILNDYKVKDSRLIIKFLGKNKGIAENFNEAIKLTSGEYILFLDHDDTLASFALFEIIKCLNVNPDIDFIYSDEDKIKGDGKRRFKPHFKPDFSQELLRCYNYMIHVSVIKKKFLNKIGYLNDLYKGSQDYDLILRVVENTDKIFHIPKILYHWRVHKDSTSKNINTKKYAFNNGKKALEDHLKRIGLIAEVLEGKLKGTYRIKYEVKKEQFISIIIPNKNHSEDLSRCIDSILYKSTYANYEIIIIENNSTEESIFNLYGTYRKNEKIRILEWNYDFNYSAINNFAVKKSKADIILLLNNDTEVINPDWLERMLEFIQRDEVGAVGAKLYYPNGKIQHGGVIVGLGGVAAHSHANFSRNDAGYFGRANVIQNLSAVTGACLMIKKHVFFDVGMFDERFILAFNDIDLCLKLREKKYLIVWTPYAELYHFESKTRGLENNPAKIKRFQGEINLFKEKWNDFLKKKDPYYNVNLTLDSEDFTLKL
ncbi:MAG: glycosyltransferase family 2 protein [Spirochaetes bacterium]|nr:glycosyltransferase family 2 protein [Spirochaetota bacterium]